MENSKKNNSSLKAIIILLALLLLGAIGYIFKLVSDNKATNENLIETVNEKDALLSELESLKKTYDEAIASNTSLSTELEAEREKVISLMNEIKSTNGSLSSFRKKYQDLEAKMKILIKENEELRFANDTLTKAIDSTKSILIEQREYNQTLLGQNEELSKTVLEGSKLVITNLKTSAFKVKNSGKEVETEKARRADILKISFTVAENKIAKSGDKSYYIQVIDSKNNVLGDKKDVQFGDQILTYSFISTINYNNKTVDVSEILKGKDFESGRYQVNIFDGSELVASTAFNLK